MSEKDSTLVTFALGALLGAALAILYAPQSGKETRKHLKRLHEDFTDSVEDFSGELKDTGRKLYEDGREILTNAKDKFSKSVNKELKETEK